MEDKPSQAASEEPVTLRKANDYAEELRLARPPELLFDEFWREGELALLFGSSGSGKSILGVQMAEAIARGRAIDGFRMPDRGRRVLYVDMEMSHAQFMQRNSISAASTDKVKMHKFSENFYREPPPNVDELTAWLRKVVKTKSVRVVVIDSLAAVRKTQDGVRETLSLMRELRLLRDELCISILVVTDCAETRRGKTLVETDMGRNRTLCSAADSVFAICRHRTHFDLRYLVQTRSRNAPIAWTETNAPLCSIAREHTGLLAFRFDDLFLSKLDDEELELICNLKMARDEHDESFRSAAELFEISCSRAHRLYHKWSPAIQARYSELVDAELKQDVQDRQDERTVVSTQAETFKSEPPAVAAGLTQRSVDPELASDHLQPPATAGGSDPNDDLDEFEEAGIERPIWLDVEANGELRVENGEFDASCSDTSNDPEPILNSPFSTINYASIPFAAGLRRRSVFEFERGIDGYGREIYIEKAFNDGRPWIWYYFDNKGELIKKVRGFAGNDVKRLGKGPYLE